jgi:hypothetical protein
LPVSVKPGAYSRDDSGFTLTYQACDHRNTQGSSEHGSHRSFHPDKNWVIPGLALGVLAVFVLSHIILYFIDKKEAEKLNADLSQYQEKQATTYPL